MTGMERLQACIALKSVDRPGLLPSFIDRLAVVQAGLTFADVVERPSEVSAAMRWLWKKLGGYGDAAYYAGASGFYRYASGYLARVKLPGKELPRDVLWQIWEQPSFRREEYDDLIKKGWNAFALERIQRVWDISKEELEHYGSVEAYHKAQNERTVNQYRKDVALWKEMGVEVFMGPNVPSPQMALSMARSLTEYTIDLYEIPEKVEEALWAALPDFIQSGIAGCEALGIPCATIILERGSAQLYPLKFFERFEWPQLKKMVDEFIAHGITPLLHLDTDWSKNLPYFRDFPKGKVIASCDGTTNLFNAKKVIGDHVCLMGDVPASLLVNGTVEEVKTYVRRLCEEVGDGGGFILGTGCSMPANALIENVQAMIDTCKSYGQ